MRAIERTRREIERQFPVRLRIGIPAGGLGKRLNAIHEWLDANRGASAWQSAPAGQYGVVNDALAIYFRDVRLAAAFAARWCAGGSAEITDGVYVVREDEPAARPAMRDWQSSPG